MHINEFPYEILDTILAYATEENARDGVQFTYGLSEAPVPGQKPALHRYPRGPPPDDLKKWFAASPLRRVCKTWHNWALEHSLETVRLQRWKGGKCWFELPINPERYAFYEIMTGPRGVAVTRDPLRTLKSTVKFLEEYPAVAQHIRRLWFMGFHMADTDHLIFRAIRCCTNLDAVSLPWTTLRHGTADDWCALLRTDSPNPLRSLELLCTDISQDEANGFKPLKNQHALSSKRVNFSALRRLKFFGDTVFHPICDADLRAMSRTATGLHELHFTCISTVTIQGVMALVKSSHDTLRVLEHSPRSDDGFFHPHPGRQLSNEHLCDLLASCPQLRDLSISLPTICPVLFSNPDVRWSGETQVRAVSLCSHATTHTTGPQASDALRSLLAAARRLTRAPLHRRSRNLGIELFLFGKIFLPGAQVVHGDFSLARVSSWGVWPSEPRFRSRKGPWGSSGVYPKELPQATMVDDDETYEEWELVGEEELLRAVSRGWVTLTL